MNDVKNDGRQVSDEVSFRDRVATIDDEGRRKWVYAKKPRGSLYRYRQLVGYSLLAFFLAGPFLKINDEPVQCSIFWAENL